MTAKRILLGVLAVAVVALGVAIWRFNMRGEGQPLSGQTRADFVRSAVEACTARQKATPVDADVTPETIGKFCDCFGETLARRVTTADLDRLTGRPPAEIQAAMREKTGDVDAVCLARLDEAASR